MRLRTCREGGHLLVSNVHPLYLALAADRVGQPVEAVPDNAIDPLHADCREGFGELISDSFCHAPLPS
jgi:hypothetical protein